jgi:hypothetical protein
MTHDKYRVYDKKNNFHQSYDGVMRGAEQFAKDCARQIKGYVLKCSADDFLNQDGSITGSRSCAPRVGEGEDSLRIYDFRD